MAFTPIGTGWKIHSELQISSDLYRSLGARQLFETIRVLSGCGPNSRPRSEHEFLERSGKTVASKRSIGKACVDQEYRNPAAFCLVQVLGP